MSSDPDWEACGQHEDYCVEQQECFTAGMAVYGIAVDNVQQECGPMYTHMYICRQPRAYCQKLCCAGCTPEILQVGLCVRAPSQTPVGISTAQSGAGHEDCLLSLQVCQSTSDHASPLPIRSAVS